MHLLLGGKHGLQPVHIGLEEQGALARGPARALPEKMQNICVQPLSLAHDGDESATTFSPIRVYSCSTKAAGGHLNKPCCGDERTIREAL